MKTQEVKVINPTGLHTRPASNLVQLAKKFESEITLKKGEKEANAKSIIKVLKIGISQGETIQLIADGPDEEKALSQITEYISNLTE